MTLNPKTMLDKSSSHLLVGKFFTKSTPPSLEETEQSLRKQWNLSGDMTVQKESDSDTLLFEFIQKKDKEEVLLKGHVNVSGVILVLKDPDSSQMIDFTMASFGVAVVGFPSYLSIKEYLPTLISQIGDTNSVKYEKSIKKGSVICFQVEVDLKKPLRPGYYFGQSRFVEFRYFNLGDFCYSCGMIGHLGEHCDQVKFPKKRALNVTSTTHVYGPWLRLENPRECYECFVTKSQNGARECENTLSYPQFFIEIKFNTVRDFNPRYVTETDSTHRFRFPCSYLDTDPNSTSKAYEVIRREIYENTPFSLGEFGDNPEVIGNLVERMRFIQKNEFCSEDKWLTLKLQINRKYMSTPVCYETMVAAYKDMKFLELIESKISDLIKKRVEANTNLLSLSSWETQIKELFSALGFKQHMHRLRGVSRVAYTAMLEAVRMEISSRSCPIPADRSTVSELKRFRVLGSDMDRLDPCTICVGEMFLGEEATNLPCSHVFHSSCIKKWLQVGHKCPLCGFKLPTHK